MPRISLGVRENWAFYISALCCIGVYLIKEKMPMSPYVILAAIMLNGAGLVFCLIAVFQSSSIVKVLACINFILLAYGVRFIGVRLLQGVF